MSPWFIIRLTAFACRCSICRPLDAAARAAMRFSYSSAASSLAFASFSAAESDAASAAFFAFWRSSRSCFTSVSSTSRARFSKSIRPACDFSSSLRRARFSAAFASRSASAAATFALISAICFSWRAARSIIVCRSILSPAISACWEWSASAFIAFFSFSFFFSSSTSPYR